MLRNTEFQFSSLEINYKSSTTADGIEQNVKIALHTEYLTIHTDKPYSPVQHPQLCVWVSNVTTRPEWPHLLDPPGQGDILAGGQGRLGA